MVEHNLTLALSVCKGEQLCYKNNSKAKNKNTPKKKLEPYQHLGLSSVMEARKHVQPKLAFTFAVICTFSKDPFFQQDDSWNMCLELHLQLHPSVIVIHYYSVFTISLMLPVVWFESQSTSLRCLLESHLRRWNLANCFVLFVLPMLLGAWCKSQKNPSNL